MGTKGEPMSFHNSELPKTMEELNIRLKESFDEGYKSGIENALEEVEMDVLINELQVRGVHVGNRA